MNRPSWIRNGTGFLFIYGLDTHLIVRPLRDHDADGIRQRRLGKSVSNVLVPKMVRAELLRGTRKSARLAHHLALVNAFLEAFKLLPLPCDAVEHNTDNPVALERLEQGIGQNDLVHCRDGEACLVPVLLFR